MENIRLEDFSNYKFLSGIKYSPDGKNACFVVHEADLENNSYHSNLWLYSIKEDRYFKLTSFNKVMSFIWLEDAEHILFSEIRDPKDKEQQESGEDFTVFYKINTHGGEAQEAFRIPKCVSIIRGIDENTFVFISQYNPNKKEIDSLREEEKSQELKRQKEEKDYEVLEEIPFWSNGGGFISNSRERLYIFHKDTQKYEALTDEYTTVEDFHLSSDKTKLVFTGISYKNKMGTENAIYICDLSSKKVKQLTPPERFSYSYADFITENNIICLGSNMKSYGINENAKFYLIDINTGKRECLTPNFDISTWNSVGSDCRYGSSPDVKMDKQYLYFITTENDSSYVNRISQEGKIEKIVTRNGSVDSYDINENNILFIGMRNMKLQELYSFDGTCEKSITHFNDWVHDNKKVSPLESLCIETEPGVFIDGWVMKPVDFDKDKKYPAILDIHGGPKTVYGQVFFHEMQYWANEGYFVFFCNPRGSDGKGNSFADIRGKYGTIDYDDIMKFTDAVLGKYPNIDEQRVGVTGGSYGGYMTNWIIGHTDRFRAAASQRSISNWISKFCTTDIGYYFVEDQNEGTPWDNHEKLWWHSPLKYADKVKTPTLFIHSQEDYRCWLPEGLQMFTALKYHGVESRLCMFRGENHELSRSGKPKHRVRRLREITDWFNHYLK